MDEKHLSKLLKKRNQRIQLLVDNLDFQKDILAIRERWNIPRSGLRDIDEWKTWYDDFLRKDDLHFVNHRKQYHEELSRLKEVDYRKYLEHKKEINLELPVNAFAHDIAQIANKYKLHPKWEEGIKGYLYYNDHKTFPMPLGVVIHKKIDMEKGIKRLFLEIDEDTTLDDIKASWKSVKYHQSTLGYNRKQKNQPIRSINLYKRAFELRKKENKSYTQIADIFEKEFPKPNEDIYSTEEIANFIRKYKKLTGSN